jgi:hypothetical protein
MSWRPPKDADRTRKAAGKAGSLEPVVVTSQHEEF